MFPENLIMFDLEYGDTQISSCKGMVPSVIEIGMLRVLKDGTQAGTFETTIQPRNWDDFTERIKSITRLDEMDLKASPYFADIYEGMCDFAGNSTLAAWGVTDTYLLRMETSLAGLRWRMSNSFLDLRTLAYAAHYTTTSSLLPASLTGACKAYGLSRQGHRALTDCKTVLRLFEAINEQESILDEGDDKFELYEY